MVLDEDPEYAQIVADTLVREPYRITIAHSAHDAIAAMRTSPHDVVIMEVGARTMPESIALVTELRRRRPGMGLIFTAQYRVAVADVVSLYEAGADEFIEKPYHPMIFAARVAAVVNRLRVLDAPMAVAGTPLEIDIRAGVVRYGKERIDVTITESLLLRELFQARGSAVSYARLNARLLGEWGSEDSETLKGHVSAVRRKLRDAGAESEMIHTERGLGYSLHT